MSASTRLEVSLEALAHNYLHLRSLIPHSTELMAVVKANAYGTDLLRLSKELDILGANSFCVAYVDEGVALRNAGISKPILVIHAQIDSLEKGVDAGLDFSLYSLDFINHLAKVAHSSNKQTTVHLNLNTGLNRLGIKPNELEEACSTLLASPQLHLGWMMTHLAASEDHTLLGFTRSQLEQFSAGTRIWARLPPFGSRPTKPWNALGKSVSRTKFETDYHSILPVIAVYFLTLNDGCLMLRN